MRKLLIILLLLLSLIITGCPHMKSESTIQNKSINKTSTVKRIEPTVPKIEPTVPKVVDKKYTPKHVTMTAVFNGVTTVPIAVPHPEKWTITIEWINNRGKTKRKTIEITKEEYENIELGQTIEIDYKK